MCQFQRMGVLPVLGILLASHSFAGAVRAEPVETEMAGVTAELLELRSQGGVLRLALRLVNGSDREATGPTLNYSELALVDAKSKQKHLLIKDADGHYLAGPIGDYGDGGRWFMRIPAKTEVMVWALFEPLPAGTQVSVQIPGMFPFDDVEVSEGLGTVLTGNVAASQIPGANLTVVSAKRADEKLTVRLKLNVVDGAIAHAPTLYYQDVFLFDPASKRKYPLLKDTEGNYIAQPVSDAGDGGRYWISSLQPGTSKLMSLTFQAPPDTITIGDLLIPGFLPIAGLAITGQGGAAAGGIAAAGKSLGLEGALKELKAEVTPQEIKINLSADVLFDFDKADLKSAAEGQLQNLLTVVRENPSAAVSVEGHTDVRGDAAYNQKLSERRAAAVKNWLVTNGTDAARIQATGAGESQPLKSGDTEADHQANRRVEILVRKS